MLLPCLTYSIRLQASSFKFYDKEERRRRVRMLLSTIGTCVKFCWTDILNWHETGIVVVLFIGLRVVPAGQGTLNR